MEKLEIVYLESEAFYKLLKQVLLHFKAKEPPKEDKWISGPEARKMLRIKSKATFQKMRDEGHISFIQPEKKIILYDVVSINACALSESQVRRISSGTVQRIRNLCCA